MTLSLGFSTLTQKAGGGTDPGRSSALYHNRSEAYRLVRLRGLQWRCALSHHQFRFDDNRLWILRFRPGVDSLQHGAGRLDSHLPQRLADGRQPGILVCGALDVVEPDDGNIFRNALARLA